MTAPARRCKRLTRSEGVVLLLSLACVISPAHRQLCPGPCLRVLKIAETRSAHHPRHLATSPRTVASRRGSRKALPLPVEGVALRLSWLSRCPRAAFTYLKVIALMLVQQRFFPRAWTALRQLWRYMGAQTLQLSTADELCTFQEALNDEMMLSEDLDLGAKKTIKAGTQVLTSWEEIRAGEPPLSVKVRPPKKREKSKRKARWQQVWNLFLSMVQRGESPFLVWGWSQLGLQAVGYLMTRFWSGKQLMFGRLVLNKLLVASSWTALAWFFHGLIGLWASNQSRGRAEHSDFLGMQSSLREARINALKTLLQVLLWCVYTFAVLCLAGIAVSRLLLIPGTTALVVGWVGREIVANMISGVVLHLTQPFAQGDWVSLGGTPIDGWVQDIGMFYTKVVQWDKRPMYVPNFKLMSMNVQNNSRMTHRRILYDLKVRIRDIPQIPQIVRDMQEMINEHEDVDNVQHRLVRWREIGDYAATIWLSCYTKPRIEGIRLGPYTAAQQSILERCSAIVYKHGAAFASITDRNPLADSSKDAEGNPLFGNLLGGKLYETFSGARERESQLESREEVLRQRERDVKERERDLAIAKEAQSKQEQEIALAREKQKQLLEQAVLRSAESRHEAAAVTADDVDAEGTYGGALADLPESEASEREEDSITSGKAISTSDEIEEVAKDDSEVHGETNLHFNSLGEVLDAAEAELKAGADDGVEASVPAAEVGEPLGKSSGQDSHAPSLETESSHFAEEDEESGLEEKEAEEQLQTEEDKEAAERRRMEEAEMMRIPVKEMGD
eukprot:TRINITY_DN19681_c0_g1_i1.p1 TRINITY_DN19681_c0_g1~~TRINITY_DN19681_c0_g1_i1.p1  ORF type:complete len:787 (-),score=188.48 TRINITY_DN19681_c0_g1_i1:126-2486(-)